jgi:glycosyltransferase involved in cell wall biosynthesis
VHRFAARGWDADVIDVADEAEIQRTEYILQRGAFPLLAATCITLFSFPLRFWAALKLTLQMMSPSDRPFAVQLVYLFEACWLARKLKAYDIRHLHAHFGTNPAAVALLTHELSGIPFSFTVHGPDEFDKAPLIHLGLKIRRAEFVVAVSSFGRSQLFRLVNQAHWGKIRVIHCGVDQLFVETSHAQPCVALRLVCVGRLCEQKGQLLLISAAAKLAQQGVKFEVVLVGDGEMRSAIETFIANQGLEEIVSITGWADGAAVCREILASRALVLPSFAEGLPVVLMEAMALGRPVLSTYIAGIPELVIDHETGWLVPAGDEGALVDAMRACFDADATTLARMGEAACRRSLMRHDVDREAAKLAALFADALRGQGRSDDC